MCFHEVGHDLSVGLGDELVAILLQLLFQLEVVFDDSVMYNDDLASAVAMGVGVLFGGAAVGGPARVPDAVGAFQRRLGDNLFEITKFARSAANFHFSVLGYDGDARGIVATVLQLTQTFDDNGNNLLGPDVADYSAHARRLLERVSSSVTCWQSYQDEFQAARRESD